MIPVLPAVKSVKLGIPGQVQQTNASLAIALVQEHLKCLGLPALEMTPTTLPSEILSGLENARWPGRCETRIEKNVTWYCDGAHTAESIAVATQWYSSLYLPVRRYLTLALDLSLKLGSSSLINKLEMLRRS